MLEVSLFEAPSNKHLKVKVINTGENAKMRLSTLGINAGDLIVKLNSNRWGPVLVSNISNDISKLAIGRGVAKNILVEF